VSDTSSACGTVVGTDGSACSPRAGALAGACGATLVVATRRSECDVLVVRTTG
jgi:hypothetical protein